MSPRSWAHICIFLNAKMVLKCGMLKCPNPVTFSFLISNYLLEKQSVTTMVTALFVKKRNNRI